MKMEIRVAVDDYEYMGLMKGSVHDASVHINSLGWAAYNFKLNGKQWSLYSPCVDPIPQECSSSYCECGEGKCSGGKEDMRGTVAEVKPVPSSALTTKPVKEQGSIKPNSPIKSDGGSSSYYDLPVSEWLLYILNERQKEGMCYIKTEEMISAFLSNDFDYGNLLKSMVRCQGLQDGTGGKAGNSVEYECNKMIYSVNKIKEKK